MRLSRVFFPGHKHIHFPHVFSHGVIFVVMLMSLILCGVYMTQRVTLHEQLSAVIASVLFSETNDARAEQHLRTLVYDEKLAAIATEKARDMVSNGYFAHTSPDGKTPWYWLEKNNYNYSYAGENLAAHFSESTDVIAAWKASPTHRENLVNESFTHVGFGVAEGVLNGAPTTFVVQLFATPVQIHSTFEPEDVLPKQLVAQATENTTAHTESNSAKNELSQNSNENVETKSPETFVQNRAEEAYVDSSVQHTPQHAVTAVPNEAITRSYISRYAIASFLISILLLMTFLYVGNWLTHKTAPHVYISKSFVSVTAFTIGLLCLVYGISEKPILPTDTQSASVIRITQ